MSYSSFFSISWRGLYIGLPIIGPFWSPHPLPLYVFIHQPKNPSTKTLNDIWWWTVIITPFWLKEIDTGKSDSA